MIPRIFNKYLAFKLINEMIHRIFNYMLCIKFIDNY